MGSCTHQVTTASINPRELIVPVWLWVSMMSSLRKRGMLKRESGAFLLGTRGKDSDRVRAFICYDDLDPHALDSGIITFDPSGYAALWSVCRQRGYEVLGDVHTHSDGSPVQSETDRTNPMMPETGHMALILPLYANCWCWKFSNVAIYEYLGNYRWRSWAGKQRPKRIRFRWLP
jgi:proteasome lid subunit RPN8/RPN11